MVNRCSGALTRMAILQQCQTTLSRREKSLIVADRCACCRHQGIPFTPIFLCNHPLPLLL